MGRAIYREDINGSIDTKAACNQCFGLFRQRISSSHQSGPHSLNYLIPLNGYDAKRQDLGMLFDDQYDIQINNRSELFGTAVSQTGYLVARFHALGEKRTYDINNRIKSNFYGTAINDCGQGIIYWSAADGNRGTCVWSTNTGLQHLCGIFSDTNKGYAINNKGQAVHKCFFYDCGWKNMNVVLNLANDASTPFESVERIYDINNKGQMVGAGYIRGKLHAVMITPVDCDCNK